MQIIERDNSLFPQSLLGYDKCPKQLYCDGDTSLLNSKCIAVIGTRYPSDMGIKTAYAIARFFAQNGFTIVAGLAIGIDAAAHKGALSVGGKTIAILPATLSKIYPRENTSLAKRIVANGGLLYTEYNDYTNLKYRLYARDHLQAAQSLAVIPVQAGEKSGTLHTVRSALAQKRLLIIPEPIRDDLEEFPDKYIGILEYMKDPRSIRFTGKQEYPRLLELLK